MQSKEFTDENTFPRSYASGSGAEISFRQQDVMTKLRMINPDEAPWAGQSAFADENFTSGCEDPDRWKFALFIVSSFDCKYNDQFECQW